MSMCNHCGFRAPDGALNCPKCGAPLANNVDDGFNPRSGGQEQPEIPAWLESLRAGGERPAPTPQNQSNFSAADLIDEGTVPSWMRAERDMSSISSVSDAFNALHPISGNTGNTGNNQQSITAQSLIDEQSLPSWMREGQSFSAIPSSGSGFDASNLVDPDAVPDWMKSLQQSQQVQQSPSTEAQAVPPMQRPAAAEPTPDWMKSLQPQSPAFGAQPVPPTPMPMEPAASASQGFSARDLIDEQSLPSWMAPQGGQPAAPGKNQQSNLLSPSSLIDQDAIPSWMREGGFSPQQGSAQQPWSPPAQPVQPVQPMANQNVPAQSGLAASSFIDMNALPTWLRSEGNQSSGGANVQQESPSQAFPYNGPPRVENMRVPSRPRGEVQANNESNEVAANVFASMIGVASSAPQFPPNPPQSQPNAQYGQYNQGPQGPQNNANAAAYQPGQGPIQGIPNTPSRNPATMQGGAPMQGIPNTPPQGYAGGGYGAASNNYAGNSMNSGMPQQYQQAPQDGYIPPEVAPSQSDEQKNAKKRGLVDTLLGWLFH
ncbi:MAG TPA: hypothetical protein VHZ51_10975 [Ktedonobacteraceae bacterium]|nr:hypothetical protein [Ktedonobacteraceae bacterium]